MADIQKLEQSLDQMIQLMVTMKQSLQEDAKPEPPKPQPAPQPKPKPQVQAQSLEYDSFDQLKDALNSDKWPEAVNPNLICDPASDTDKLERGRGIIELMIEEDLKGLKFLDYGCGEGHTPFLATEYSTEMSVGYDPKRQDQWTKFEAKPNFLLTDNFEEIQQHAPYDIIVLFDVIDHVKAESPEALLGKVKSLLKDDGKVYMRCHPLTSRHATHLYHELNKAFVHLVFTPEEIQQLVPNAKYVEESIGVKYPLRTYHGYLDAVGLNSVNRRDITEKVEPFFKIPKIAERIIQQGNFSEFPEFQMSLQFVDFVLKKK
jgi:2-polyprenyl-3-methyl-5-hydroxy-6-metoxy-1,4-benzoquinol methylase